MQAVLFHEFGGPLSVETVPDPTPAPDGAVIRVEATGLCRSDWHGWRGHDADITELPHVPGHELAGEVVEVGSEVDREWIGRRVTIPFVAGCGNCGDCDRGAPQVCPTQYQPGFSGWGSYAEYVAVRYAANNLIALPEGMSCEMAASLGCRLATSFRAVAQQGRVAKGEWVAVHGCGGVGLSAVMVAKALGAQVVAIDVRPEPLAKATELGADATIQIAEDSDVESAVRSIEPLGMHVSIDALGHTAAMQNSILSLRRSGRHVQVGLLAGTHTDPATPWGRVVAWELELLGSHGMSAGAYPDMFAMVADGRIDPALLLERTISLDETPEALAALDDYQGNGVTVIKP